ncbi:MAG: hypothetical protein JO016_06075 [Actinobacteria bacterium]|nr:hypothetical protein [Actinomycetota bacterium]
MGTVSGPDEPDRPTGHRPGFVTGGAFGLLLVLGLLEGLIGSFAYSTWSIGSFPAASILLCLILVATCVLGAWGMTSVTGALAPALGWIVASFVLDSPSRQGSVVVAAVPSGEWYLYGGAVSALLGIAVAFAFWIRRAGQKLSR